MYLVVCHKKYENRNNYHILNSSSPQGANRNGTATAEEILFGPVRGITQIDPSSLPLGNSWHGKRKKDHGYRGPIPSYEQVEPQTITRP